MAEVCCGVPLVVSWRRGRHELEYGKARLVIGELHSRPRLRGQPAFYHECLMRFTTARWLRGDPSGEGVGAR
jgi:hypothetical protein